MSLALCLQVWYMFWGKAESFPVPEQRGFALQLLDDSSIKVMLQTSPASLSSSPITYDNHAADSHLWFKIVAEPLVS